MKKCAFLIGVAIGAYGSIAKASETDDRVAALEQELAQLRSVTLGKQPLFTLRGYGDFGFFATQGNGSGVRQDTGLVSQRHFPQYADSYAWVFLGDLLAPAVNSRGEPADLGNLPGIDRLDAIDSNGAPGFIVNELNLTFTSRVAESALATASINFLPRTGTEFRFGDLFDVDRVDLEWMLGAERKTSLFFGKMEPVLGIEYRQRKADRRFGITPSLLARYTTGTPLGIKLRSKLVDDQLVFAFALTNGSSGIETFHFYNETDSNAGKTASGRLSWAPRVFGARDASLELGVSGEYGAQDHALDSTTPLWFFGADLMAHLGNWELRGQWLRGSANGDTNGQGGARTPWGLRLNHGGYVELVGMLGPVFGTLVRIESRDAMVWQGDPTSAEGALRLYVSKVWRLTVGCRIVVNERLVVKLEALHNQEFGGLPSIPDDVLTSSLLMQF